MKHTEPDTDIIKCPYCNGTGFFVYKVCPKCDGTGEYKIDYRDLGVKK